MSNNARKIATYALWILVFELVASQIGRLTQPGISGWYAGINKPPLLPPNIVFPIVWTALYALMGAVAARLWLLRDGQTLAPLRNLFFIYMVMNWSWSFIFFTYEALLPSFVWLVVMDVVALLLIASAWTRDRLVAWLMIPTVVWTLFAAYLNGGCWYLNPPV